MPFEKSDLAESNPVRPLIFACALSEELLTRAMAGDLEALRRVRSLLGDVPARERRAERVWRVRGLADRIRAGLPLAPIGQVARIIAEASERLEEDRPLEGATFDGLDSALRDQLEQAIGAMLRWAPLTKNRRSLGRKQVEGIIRAGWKS